MSFIKSLFGIKAKNLESITLLDAISFRNAIEQAKVQLVDVRTPREFATSHLKNALNVDYFNASSFSAAFNKMKKDKPVYVYCRSGNRSRNAARRLHKLGFKEIYDLKGGLLSYSKF